MEPYRVPPNSRYPRCVDCRAAEVFVDWQTGHWNVTRRGAAARAENGPQFPGASLLFVRALEVVGRHDRESAFYLTEQASQRAGLGVQVHVDDQDGAYDYAVLDDRALVDVAARHHTGCGFAGVTWGDEAGAVVAEAKRRHWRVQYLAGPKDGRGATINYRPGETFDTAAAVAGGASIFNLDVLPARRVLESIESLIVVRGFAAEAEAWMVNAFGEVVTILGGIASPDEVRELR